MTFSLEGDSRITESYEELREDHSDWSPKCRERGPEVEVVEL